MLQIVLIRPGSTDFDDQGRIKGTLDLPLNQNGEKQVAQMTKELASMELDVVYYSPHQAAQQTAEAIAQPRETKVKPLEKLKNMDHGLWHGKLIEEVKHNQPKVYRQWQEHPETVCPPEGETLKQTQDRARSSLVKIMKSHTEGVIAMVLPEPFASVVLCLLSETEIRDLWSVECESGSWELLEIQPQTLILCP